MRRRGGAVDARREVGDADVELHTGPGSKGPAVGGRQGRGVTGAGLGGGGLEKFLAQ